MKISYSKLAEKEILALDRSIGQRIFKKIDLLKDQPFGLGSQKLAGNKGYRIRISDYRVVYKIDKVSKSIIVIKVKHRREVYR